MIPASLTKEGVGTGVRQKAGDCVTRCGSRKDPSPPFPSLPKHPTISVTELACELDRNGTRNLLVSCWNGRKIESINQSITSHLYSLYMAYCPHSLFRSVNNIFNLP
jgi:hypothetical protein